MIGQTATAASDLHGCGAEAETIPSLVIFRLDAPLFFANASRFREGVIGAVEAAPESVTEVLIDAEVMYDIDSTGAQTFVELLDELDAREITLSMARVRTEIRDELYEGAIEQRIGADRIYLEIDDGAAFLQRNTDPQTD